MYFKCSTTLGLANSAAGGRQQAGHDLLLPSCLASGNIYAALGPTLCASV